MRRQKFHGRYESAGRMCEAPACCEPGEFRAPSGRGSGIDGPAQWRWFCLDHVREFNSGYDWFAGMSAAEIIAAQSPIAGWASESRVFRPDPGAQGLPRWADFADPLDAIGERAQEVRGMARARQARWGQEERPRRFTAREREALGTMGLSPAIDRQTLRRRYSELVRRYHPDRNGGDRSHEGRLARVVEAYQVLRKAEGLE